MIEKPVRISALILAAGAARRFGQPKQLLPWGPDNTILGTVIDTVSCNSKVTNINVVLGAHYDSITSTIPEKLSKTHIIRNTLWQRGMFSSITAGLLELSTKSEAGGILVLLGDMPFISPQVIVEFIHAASACTSENPLIIATEQGKPAHPYLIWQQHIGEILSLSGKSGIRPFIQSQFPHAEKIQVSSNVGRQDIDTWEAYEQLKPKGSKKSIRT
ncbi:MAG: NTP transferase domain-containing protein [Xanthomonadaceae bacterium]|nr:NTP transferase domain-containing protein [Xanthomonadaceae bacterium]